MHRSLLTVVVSVRWSVDWHALVHALLLCFHLHFVSCAVSRGVSRGLSRVCRYDDRRRKRDLADSSDMVSSITVLVVGTLALGLLILWYMLQQNLTPTKSNARGGGGNGRDSTTRDRVVRAQRRCVHH